MIHSSSMSSPIGQLTFLWEDALLLRVDFEQEGEVAVEAYVDKVTPATKLLEEELGAYFAGEKRQWKTKASLPAKPFQRAVLLHLQTVPYGETGSYEDLAKMMGHPKAYRAVATALAKNPLPLVFPCHRILRKGGALGGFNGGLWRKEWLLKHESVDKKCLLS